MKTRTRTCTGLIVSAVLAATTVSYAQDQFSGTHCVDVDDTSPDIRYPYNGSAWNFTGSATAVFCPVDSDIDAGYHVGDWDLYVARNGSTAAWSITMWVTNSSGTSGFSSTINVPVTQGFLQVDGPYFYGNFGNATQTFITSSLPAGAEIDSFNMSPDED
jgi:hypothetical protein